MGCDIHGWIEVKVGDKYVAVKELEDRSRNYKRFAALAGVRNSCEMKHVIPKGIPSDISDTARYHVVSWGVDGHSHSYLPLKDAAEIFLSTDYGPPYFAKTYPLLRYFDYDDDVENARLVFWFDN
jgi:hypothetical protein